MPKIENQKVALVTGIAGGIGQATAKLLSDEGWFVVGIDLSANLDLVGVDLYISADLANPEQIANGIAKLTEIAGRLDVLVNNAAIQICKPVSSLTLQEWDLIMNVNVRAAFLLSQGCYPLLKASCGNIVNISSVHALATSSSITAYAASKGAITALTRALAVEWAKDNIRVNAVLPGAVDTTMLESGLTRGHLTGSNLKELKSNLAQKTVMGKIGKPEDIAKLILFLADNYQSSFMTGQSIVIDGGATIKLSTE